MPQKQPWKHKRKKILQKEIKNIVIEFTRIKNKAFINETERYFTPYDKPFNEMTKEREIYYHSAFIKKFFHKLSWDDKAMILI